MYNDIQWLRRFGDLIFKIFSNTSCFFTSQYAKPFWKDGESLGRSSFDGDLVRYSS